MRIKKNNFKYIDLYKIFLQGEDFSRLINFLETHGGIDATDEEGRTALITCIVNIDDPIKVFPFANNYAKQLIKLGSDINKEDLKRYVPLHYCLLSKNYEILDCLLDNPIINLDVKPRLLDFAFSKDINNSNLIIKLLKLGLNPFEKNDEKESFYETLQLFDKGIITIGGNNIDVTKILQTIKELYPGVE